MSARSDDRELLESSAQRNPEGWAAGMIRRYGLEGAVDLMAAMDGRPHDIDLRRRPFSSSFSLKQRVVNARIAVSALMKTAYAYDWAEQDAEKSSDAQ